MDILIFLSITVFFLVFLVMKEITGKKICAICTGVSATWIIFLVLYRLGYVSDSLLIGILMGESVIGIFYLTERRTKEEIHFFRLPFLLTLTFLAYALISWALPYQVLGFVLGLWVLYAGIYLFRKKPALNKMVKKIIKCCKNW